jgi:polysaccharide export outer membrane protein
MTARSWLVLLVLGVAQSGALAAPPPDETAAAPSTPTRPPIVQLGPGDQVKMDVFGSPEMGTTMYVADDGTIGVPLAGAVHVAGLSPVEAADKVASALKDGQYLVDPHVTLAVVQSLSQRVSVLGEVKLPGRYPIESNSTILDVLAQAGGRTDKASDLAYLYRADAAGKLDRVEIDLKGFTDTKAGAASQALQSLRGGDRIVVPAADHVYVTGEVRTPGAYRLERGMSVLQAIALAGGVTDKGSMRRIEIKRQGPPGHYTVISAKAGDSVQAEDLITVKERIF